jgi:hypothetical protein
MLQPLVVTELAGPAAAPAAAPTFTLRDLTFEVPEQLPAGTTTYRVVDRAWHDGAEPG